MRGDEVAHEAEPFGVVGRRRDGVVVGGCVPAGAEAAEVVAACRGRGVQRREEGVVAHRGAQVVGVGEDGVGAVQRRDPGVGVVGAAVLDVAGEDGAFEALGADHVVGEQQHVGAREGGVVAGDGVGELGDRAGGGVVGEEAVQDGHEVGLARPEAAV